MEKGCSDSLDGLKFGKKIYFEDVGSGGSSSMAMAMTTASDAHAKKGKIVQQQPPPQPQPHSQQQKAPRCQVEGCKVDLTGVKAYYCRHKVCGMHSKSPKVVVAGIEQRFCQQCSRFHQLNEFDQGKRSCRRRLAGHNERRRKPPPGPLPPGYGRFSPSFHEDTNRFRSFLMDFTYPRPPPANPRELWPTSRGGDRLASGSQWQGSFSAHGASVATQPYMQSASHFAAHDEQLPPSERVAGVADSSCALSLLSNQAWVRGGAADPRSRGSIAGPTGDHTTIPSNYVAASNWGFRGYHQGTGSGPHEIQHEIRFGNFSNASSSDQFSGELELALEGNRLCPDHGPRSNYDHAGGMMHWSL